MLRQVHCLPAGGTLDSGEFSRNPAHAFHARHGDFEFCAAMPDAYHREPAFYVLATGSAVPVVGYDHVPTIHTWLMDGVPSRVGNHPAQVDTLARSEFDEWIARCTAAIEIINPA